MEVNQKTIMLQRPLIVKPTPGRPDRQVPPRRGRCSCFSQNCALRISLLLQNKQTNTHHDTVTKSMWFTLLCWFFLLDVVPLSRDGSFGPSPVSGGNPSPTQMMEVPSRPLSAPQREGSRAEFGKQRGFLSVMHTLHAANPRMLRSDFDSKDHVRIDICFVNT